MKKALVLQPGDKIMVAEGDIRTVAYIINLPAGEVRIVFVGKPDLVVNFNRAFKETNI